MIDEEFSYLAVAESRQFFTLMAPYVLFKYTQYFYTAHPSDMVLKTAGEQKCLIEVFLDKMDIVLKKCKRLLLNESFDPIWKR
jgi:hypothetical protein